MFTASVRFTGYIHYPPKNKSDIGATPWLDHLGNLKEGWSPYRIKIARLVQSKEFESFLGMVIVMNMGLMCYQADYEAQCHPQYNGRESSCPYKNNGTLWMINLFLLLVYTVELSCRLCALRGHFADSRWNLLDVVIIILGWIGEIAHMSTVNITYLRILRLARLVRAFQIAFQIRELYLMLNGVANSIRAIIIGALTLFGMLLTYSIILVELVHPRNSELRYEDCDDCHEGFSTVWKSVMTLFRALIAGDSWIVSLKLLGGSPWLAPIMIFVVITITLGMMNLILTVIVERAADAREKDIHNMARQKMQAQKELKHELITLCKEIDENGDGKMTICELLAAFDDSARFRDLMTLLDVHKSELEVLLKVMDQDGSGYLDYEEFCDELSRYKSFDRSMMLVLMKFNIVELQKNNEGPSEQKTRACGVQDTTP